MQEYHPTVLISYLLCTTVSKQSGSTVRGKDVRIDQVSMFSWFSTWPLFALWRRHPPWRRQKMLNWRRSSASRGINLNLAVLLSSILYLLLPYCLDNPAIHPFFNGKYLLEWPHVWTNIFVSQVSPQAAVRGDPRRLSQPSSSNSTRCGEAQSFTCSPTRGSQRGEENQCTCTSRCSVCLGDR